MVEVATENPFSKGTGEEEIIKVSPYELKSVDTPALVITQIKLTGDNYEEWARAVRIALRAKRKFGFVDGSIPLPEDDEEKAEEWWIVNAMLVSWIFNTIDGSLRNSITQVEEAALLWNDIQERFSVANGPRVNQLKKELANCRQNGQSITSYYGRMKSIWDKLGSIENLPACAKCRACKCGTIKTIETQKEEEKVHQFLMGLDNEGYSGVRSNILSTVPIAPLNRVYSTIIQQEGVLKVTTQEEEKNPVSFAVVGRTDRDRANRDITRDVRCKHCGVTGHEISGCFQLIGYPEWWGDRPRGQIGGRGGGRNGRGGGRQGGRTGTPGGRNNRTTGTGAGFGATTTAHTARAEKGKGDNEGFTSEQWSTLMNLLKEKDIPLENKFSVNLENTSEPPLVNNDEDHPSSRTTAQPANIATDTPATETSLEPENSPENSPEPVHSPDPIPLRRSTRERQPSTRLRDFVVHVIQGPAGASPPSILSSVALSRFLSKIADRATPFCKTIKKAKGFAWTEDCQRSLEALKAYRLSLPVLSKPKPGETLYLYQGVSPHAVSSVLLREEDGIQQPVYYVARVLRGAELRLMVSRILGELEAKDEKMKKYRDAALDLLRGFAAYQWSMSPEKTTLRKDWVEELPYIIWTYQTAPRKTTQETLFSLTYGFEARALTEISLLSYRVENFDAKDNERNLVAELHLIDERRERSYMRAENYHRQVKTYHDQRV
ncbi:unnamed protein product [Cuscuta campestris]|uniref:Retrotransposon Copia-like N-terminal domain-containing protein n=1 Tax=Cuscuta campestris TaxID=132261 RepID=A0A484MT75_9ASTE|nr:unnamed protein product [Cuscuta campestris]